MPILEQLSGKEVTHQARCGYRLGILSNKNEHKNEGKEKSPPTELARVISHKNIVKNI